MADVDFDDIDALDEGDEGDDGDDVDLYSVEPDGTKTNAWIMDELLGDDDLDEGDYAHVLGEPDEPDEDDEHDEDW